MASRRQRRRRRERRRARIKYPSYRRYLTHCEDTEGKPANHWIYITSKGDIIFRDHRESDLKSMAAEGLLRKGMCPGCFWAALRFIYTAQFLEKHFLLGNEQRRNQWDKKLMSSGLYYYFENDLHKLRALRLNKNEVVQASEVLPLLHTLQYRRELLKMRMAYRVDSLVVRIQKRLPEYADESLLDLGDAEKPFTMDEKYGIRPSYTYPQDKFRWDY